jgi:hypothetical protein
MARSCAGVRRRLISEEHIPQLGVDTQQQAFTFLVGRRSKLRRKLSVRVDDRAEIAQPTLQQFHHDTGTMLAPIRAVKLALVDHPLLNLRANRVRLHHLGQRGKAGVTQILDSDHRRHAGGLVPRHLVVARLVRPQHLECFEPRVKLHVAAHHELRDPGYVVPDVRPASLRHTPNVHHLGVGDALTVNGRFKRFSQAPPAVDGLGDALPHATSSTNSQSASTRSQISMA